MDKYRSVQELEFVTTFHPNDESAMFVIYGNNINFTEEKPAMLFMYLYLDGEISNGIDSFIFFNRDEINTFLERLPTMTVFDFLLRGSGVQPCTK